MTSMVTPDITVECLHPSMTVNAPAVEAFTRRVIEYLGLSVAELNIIFTDNEYLRTLHHRFLNDDSDTDIMTFPLHEPGEPISADIFISLDMAGDNARFYGVSVEEELRRLIVHGLLHLAGWDDQTEAEQHAMREKENEVLRQVSSGEFFLNGTRGK